MNSIICDIYVFKDFEMDINDLIKIDDLADEFNVDEEIIKSLMNMEVISPASYGEINGVLFFNYKSVEIDIKKYNFKSEKCNADKIKDALNKKSKISNHELIIFIRDLLSEISLCFFKAIHQLEGFVYTDGGFESDIELLIEKAKAIDYDLSHEQVKKLEDDLTYAKKDIFRNFQDGAYMQKIENSEFCSKWILQHLFADLSYFSKQLFPSKLVQVAGQDPFLAGQDPDIDILEEALFFYENLKSDESDSNNNFDSYFKDWVVEYQSYSDHKEAINEMLSEYI